MSSEMGSPKRRPQNATKIAQRSISLKRANKSGLSGSSGGEKNVNKRTLEDELHMRQSKG